MNWLLNILCGTMAVVGVVGCGLFAGLETGVYSLNRVRLRLLVHQGDPRAKLLDSMLAHPAPGGLIATLLIGTGITTYFTSAAAGILLDAHDLSPWRVILYDVLIVTPVLFVLSDVLPKDLFAAHADRLVYPFARPLSWMMKALTVVPLLPLISLVSRGVMWLLGLGDTAALSHPRRQVSMLVREGVGLGLLSDEQSAITERVMGLGDRHVGDEAVPWDRVIKVNASDPSGVLWDLANRSSFSRFPVIGPGGDVTGVVHIFDALLHPRESCPPIAELARPVPKIDENTPLRPALTQMQASGTPMAIVTQRGRPSGLVTIKDLVEPITGELASW